MYTYILITPARNEEAHIEKTIQSMISQTILPEKWIIISDRSTDRTDKIASGYALEYNWIEIIHRHEQKNDQFAGKVQTFNLGYEKIKTMNYDIIGNLDADVAFENDYMEFLLSKFAAFPDMGVAGTPFKEDSFHSFNDSCRNQNHVSGACQLFRRDCFEAIGGYLPIKAMYGGSEDWIAVTSARMKGWKTRTFCEKILLHHRKMGTAGNNYLKAKFKQGIQDYYLGGHPLWEFFRFIFQLTRKPFVIGAFFLMAGYISAFLQKIEYPISKELINFNRKEQLIRLKKILHDPLYLFLNQVYKEK